MVPHKVALSLSLILFAFITLLVFGAVEAVAQHRKVPTGGRLGVVIDERLAALRATPQLNGKLVRRLGRGRLVAIRSVKIGPDGVTFLLVNVTSRTHGWIQRESVVSPSRAGDDLRLFQLIQHSDGFDRISRARIFLDHFHRSPLRPAVLLLLGDTAEALATKLSQSATHKLNAARVSADTPFEAPEFTYYLNYSALDRYNRQGINFLFNPTTKHFHYDGTAYRLLVRHHPHSPEAAEAKQRLLALAKHME